SNSLEGLQYLTELKSLSIAISIYPIEALEEEFPLKLETVILEAKYNEEIWFDSYDNLLFYVGGLPNTIRTLKISSGSYDQSVNASVEINNEPTQLVELFVEGVYTNFDSPLPPTLKKYTINYSLDWYKDYSN